MKKEVKYTPQGFSYVDITLKECINWGGCGICNSCGTIANDLKLVYVLGDTYCEKCFNEWLERAKNYSEEDIKHDLNVQKDRDIAWYEYLLKREVQ